MTFERSVGAQKSDPAARVRTGATAAPTNNTQALWVEAHAPTFIESVCVAPKKAKEILQWLEEGDSGLLVLVGSPGIGKSTVVRILAQIHGFELHEWSESVSSASMFYNPEVLAQPTPLDSFEAFLQQSRVGYSSIVSSRAMHISKPASNAAKKDQRSLILLEEIPNLHGAEMEDRFRTLFTTHVIESTRRATRTVLVWSDVTEGKHHRDDLERLVQPHVLYDARYVQILQVHPPTRARFGKVVEAIARLHKIRNVDAQALYDASGGDLRFAITALQFDGGTTTGAASAVSSDRDMQKRDERLNPMHALGKLLYAKRKEPGAAAATASPSNLASRWHDPRGPLAFDPDDVLDRCEMELPGALQFLAYHAPDFMTDVEELGDALASYSDAAWLMDAGGSSSGRASAPAAQRLVTSLASSVAGRAAATFNVHPAPFKFRQLSKPRSFDALRKRSENQAMLKHALSKTAASLEGVDQYATDSLAFVRRIRPEAAPQLESFVASSTSREWRPADRLLENDDLSAIAFSTLEGDDIAEYSDGDDLPERKPHVEMPRLSFQLTKPTGCDATQTTVATSPSSSASTP